MLTLHILLSHTMKIKIIITVFVLLNLIKLNSNAATGEIIKITPTTGSLIYGHMNYDQTDSSLVFAGIDDNQHLIFTKFLNSAATADLKIQSTASFNATRINIKRSINGNFYYGSFGDINSHYFFKLDSAFNFVFCTGFTLSGISNDKTTTVEELTNGDFIGLNEGAVVRLNANGLIKWVKALPYFGFQSLRGLKILNGSKFLILGDIYRGVSVSNRQDVFICCMDTSAQILWSKSLGSDAVELANCAAYSNGGKIFIGGYYYDNYNSNNLSGSFISSFDTLGNLLNHNFLKSTLSSSMKFLACTPDNHISAIQYLSNAQWVYTLFDSNLNVISSHKLNLGSIFGLTALSDSSIVIDGIDANSDLISILSKNELPSCIIGDPIYFQEKLVTWQNTTLGGPATTSVSANLNLGYNNIVQPANINYYCVNTCNVKANFESTSNAYCVGSNILFSNLSELAGSYSWYVNGVLVSSAVNFSYTFNNAGQQIVKLIASNGNCSDTLELAFMVELPPIANFTYHHDGKLLNCVPSNLNNDNYHWDFGNGIALNTLDSANYVYPDLGIFNVCLTVNNQCSSVTSCSLIDMNVYSSGSFQTALSIPGMNNYQMDITQLANGDFMVAGQTEYSSSSPVGGVVKLNKHGIIKNAFHLNGVSGTATDDQYIEKINMNDNGEVYFTGIHKYSFTGAKTFYGVMDSSYNFISRFVYLTQLTDVGSGLTPLPDHCYAFTYSSNNETILAKLDAQMNILWRKSYTGTDRTKAVKAYDDGSIIVLCANNNNAGLELIKTDANGNLIWAYNYAGPSTSNDLYGFEKTKSGNLLISGSNGSNPFILCVDSSGQVLWSKSYTIPSTSNCRIRTIEEGLDGNIYFSYDQSFAPWAFPGFLCKADSLGNLIKVKKESGYIKGMAATMDTALVIVAQLASGVNTVIKFDKNFDTPCAYQDNSGTAQNIVFNRSVFSFTILNPTFIGTAIGEPSTYYQYNPGNVVSCSSSIDALNVDFNYVSTCAGVPMHFNAIISGSFAQLNWIFNGAQTNTSTSLNPDIIWTQAGTYVVTLTVTDSLGNQIVHTENVVVDNFPIFTLSDYNLCIGSSVQLIAYTGGNQNVTWSPSTGLSTTIGTTTMANPTQTTTYYATLTSAPGCSVTDSSLVTVNPVPSITATIPDTICMNESVSFFASGANNYSWYSNNQLIANGDTAGPFTFGNSYFIKVIGTNNFGCRDTVIQYMYQDTCYIVVGNHPNTINSAEFSIFPNPADNLVNIVSIDGINKVCIYDIAGRLITTINSINKQENFQIDISDVEKGLYFIQLINDNIILKTSEIVIF